MSVSLSMAAICFKFFINRSYNVRNHISFFLILKLVCNNISSSDVFIGITAHKVKKLNKRWFIRPAAAVYKNRINCISRKLKKSGENEVLFFFISVRRFEVCLLTSYGFYQSLVITPQKKLSELN